MKANTEVLCGADVDDAGTEFFGFVGAHAGDGLELGYGPGAWDDDAAERGRAEDEELG